ncbi:hypothetical protein KP509_18G066800 [Ceratopteris richardii]|uniref:histone deacetylase n=1 Tax=Ceratopteris richardii TaxID=49495 RepID=A0A8T2SQK8_CERRI|nr:hypothetical protein KP509_18G066800 [Ceratopteris richardii]KAH7366195.1 hypothetical protein KP509_18G066800 [Ceratopteris richardii]
MHENSGAAKKGQIAQDIVGGTEDVVMEDGSAPKADGNGLENLKSMYEHEGDWDSEEEDDKDWNPDVDDEDVVLVEWFCTNCTDSNADDVFHCEQCGEHKHSGILKNGFLAPMDLPESESELEPGTDCSGPESKPPLASPPFWSSEMHPVSTAVGFDERMLLHSEAAEKPHPHPERADRLRAIIGGFHAAGLFSGRCCRIPSREATREEMEWVHSHLHVSAVEATSSQEASSFGRDTYVNSHSALAARLASGACVDIMKAIIKGQVLNGFALVRPPGHHAMTARAMGFCLHNNAALAAKAALISGAKKVMILDWDVHHGNGTQEIFESDPSVLYVSLHRHQGGLFYPGTGAATEVGVGDGEGFSVNIPWPCGGIGDEDYLFAFQNVILPIAEQFAPDVTIISAGFDAAKGDPLGGCQVTPLGYAYMTQMLYSLMKGKILAVLEGGYNLRSISASSTAVMKVLMGESPGVPQSLEPTIPGLIAVLQACKVQSRYWRIDPMCILKMQLQLASSEVKLKGKHGTRQMRRGPVWWRWGRKRVVYDHCFNTSGTR